MPSRPRGVVKVGGVRVGTTRDANYNGGELCSRYPNRENQGMDEWTVYEDSYFVVVAPRLPLHCRGDGGHLMLVKKTPVFDRSDMSPEEAIDFIRVSMAVGRAMYDVLKIERMNYEDLGNWGLDDPDGPKMHMHFFGRAHEQVHQIRGQHIFLYPQGHPIYDGHLEPLNASDVAMLRARVEEILTGEKYRRLAELAGLV